MSSSIVIVAIGTELTQGKGLDTNGPWLARELGMLGLVVASMVTISDDRVQLLESLRAIRAAGHSIVTIGGLGPTEDDRTRDVIAAFFGVGLKKDKSSRASLSKRYGGVKLSESAKVQTRFPEGSIVLENQVGVAPGFLVPSGTRFLAALPGPPKEFKSTVLRGLLPELSKILGLGKKRPAKELTVFGITEPACNELCKELLVENTDIKASILASNGRVVLRWQPQSKAGETLAKARSKQAKKILGRRVVAENAGEEALAEEVVGKLIAGGHKVALAESCTGGRVASRITGVAGSSRVFEYGVVSYSNRIKELELGVAASILEESGAVSGECVAAMAKGAMKASGADIAVAISGIAGPDGGSNDKPVGLVWFALRTKLGGKVKTKEYACFFRGDRERVQRNAALNALDLIRLTLEERRPPKKRDVAYLVRES